MAKKTQTLTPKVVIAGPGAGKTHNMVQDIAACVPKLHPCRFLAAITYTNAAADVIRTRLGQRMHPPRNVFVGTIHAFLNRFVLSPYATLLGELPDDKLFMAVDLDSATAGKKVAPAKKAIIRNKMTAALLKKGVVPYEQMVAISAALVEKPTVRAALGRRLQFLFVDEFQDVDTSQLRVFEAFRKEGRTSVFAVGDPEQYISSFTYGQRGAKAPKYASIPFFRFAEKAQRSDICGNRRSCVEIVEFLNRFHTHLDQKSLTGTRGTPRVFFLPETVLS